MSKELGNYAEDATIDFTWDTNDSSGGSITRAADGTITVYKGNSTSGSTAGVTDTEDFNSLTGVHHCRIDTSADAFYATGYDYHVVLSAATIDGQTVNATLARFSIENRFDEVDVVAIEGSDPTDQINAAVDAALDTAIPGVPTANSINERLATVDDLLGNLATASVQALDDILDGSGAVATFSQIRVDSSDASGAIDIDNDTGPAIDLRTTAPAADCVDILSVNADGIEVMGGAYGISAFGVTADIDGDLAGTVTGDVDGNVGGNVVGSVGSVAAGGISAASFATDAIDADALKADAVTEIQSGLSTLDAAGVRTAVGLASANLDTQLGNIVTDTNELQTDWHDGGRLDTLLDSAATGAAGSGARTVTVTVNDGSNPLQSARVRFTKGAATYVQNTDASGNATFNLDDGTWTVAITLIGYTYAGTTQVVDGDETPTYSMTALTITEPSDPSLCTVQFRVKLSNTAVSGAVCKARLLGINHASDGTVLSNEESSDTTDSQGVAELQLVQMGSIVKGSALYKIEVEIDGEPVANAKTRIPNQSTCLFEDLL